MKKMIDDNKARKWPLVLEKEEEDETIKHPSIAWEW